MGYPRVLVVESQGFKRSALVRMLQRLGVRDLVLARDGEQAMSQLLQLGPVDVVLCDIAGHERQGLDFLEGISQQGLAEALILSVDTPPDIHRALGQLPSFSGLALIGVIERPLSLRPLHKVLSQYRRPAELEGSAALANIELPSEADLRLGLALGEFRGWYQPKRVMATGQLAGAEVLVRWEHPSRGVLLPQVFLAGMVAYNLIDEMFKQLFDQAMGLLLGLRLQGVDLELSFNLHASQLDGPTLVKHIQRTLLWHELPGDAFTFELAENGLLALKSATQENLVCLRMLGCSLAVDDFGMGFSSLKMLGQLPFNQLKLDGSVIHDLTNPGSRAVVAGALALTRALHMELVIEGVSSQTTQDILTAMGCRIGQGYHLALPMNAGVFLRWLETLPAPALKRS
ncbi:EAL domain-containing response regulator [Pseudomonas rhodesiae]|uniref:EAL domain-containing response regulator n=1 Tax=Pseudomonas rhodesiae TaxID=76760 RepID=UPI0032B296EC